MTNDNDNNPEIQYSPLCGDVMRDGLKVNVQIYRLACRADGWSPEVVDHEGTSTVWSELFATEQAAYAEFVNALETEGIRSFSEQAPGRLH
jgi:hypothetical protein